MSKYLSLTSKFCLGLALFFVSTALVQAATNFITYNSTQPAFILDNNVQINGNVGVTGTLSAPKSVFGSPSGGTTYNLRVGGGAYITGSLSADATTVASLNAGSGAIQTTGALSAGTTTLGGTTVASLNAGSGAIQTTGALSAGSLSASSATITGLARIYKVAGNSGNLMIAGGVGDSAGRVEVWDRLSVSGGHGWGAFPDPGTGGIYANGNIGTGGDVTLTGGEIKFNSANGLMLSSNDWNSGENYVDQGWGYIVNDRGSYQTLMIVGNNSAGGVRRVKVWDDLSVNSATYTRDLAVGGAAWPGENNAAIAGNLTVGGTISGNGSGLTSVNADLLDGYHASSFVSTSNSYLDKNLGGVVFGNLTIGPAAALRGNNVKITVRGFGSYDPATDRDLPGNWHFCAISYSSDDDRCNVFPKNSVNGDTLAGVAPDGGADYTFESPVQWRLEVDEVNGSGECAVYCFKFTQ